MTTPRHAPGSNVSGKHKRIVTPNGPGRGSAAQYRIVVDSVSDAVVSIDQSGVIVFANHAVERIFGHAPRALIGKDIGMLLPERIRATQRRGLQRFLDTPPVMGTAHRMEFPGLHSSGAELDIELSFGASVEHGTTYFTGVARDITARKRAERRTSLQYAVTRVIAGSAALSAALPRLLQAVADATGADFAEFWQPGSERRELRSAGTWVAAGRARSLDDATVPAVPLTAGLPARVWASRRAEATTDLADAGFLRPGLAQRAGLRVAIGVPILRTDTTIGLIACYTPDPRPPEAETLESLEAVGKQIGDFIARTTAEEGLRTSEERLRALVRNAYSGIQLLDREGRLTFVSESVTRVLGYAPEELTGQRAADFVHPDDRLAWREFFARCLARPQESVRIEYRCRHKDGTWRYIEGVGVNRLGEPAVGGVVDNFRDITDRKRAEIALRQSEQRYSLAARGSNDGLWDWDLDAGTIYFSDRWRSMLGYQGSDVGNTPEAWHALIHPDDAAEVQARVDAHLSGQAPQFQSEHRVRHRDGDYRWVLVRGVAVRDADGRAHRMAGSQTDITDRKAAEDLLLHEAMHDPLTELPNRSFFLDLVGRAMARARADHTHHFAILFLDLDRFKVVNDSLGHTVGDELLVTIARRIEKCVRPGDTVARLGGDEFTILLEPVTDLAEATVVAERIQKSLAVEFAIREHEVFVSASIGIAHGAPAYAQPEELLRDADLAMYRAKAHGKARHEVFDMKLREQMVRLLRLETELRRAIDRNQFILHYQPIVSLVTRHITGYEALVRWQHPERGLVMPDEFIPVAEETGLIVPLGEWVMNEVCRQARVWADARLLPPGVTISLNLSGRQFRQPDLVRQISHALSSAGVDASRLTLEITESVVMDDAAMAVDLLNGLHEMDLKLYIDDFGTGYSSLSYLERFPIDTLKIDRMFVHNIDDRSKEHGVVRAVVLLAHNLGLDVIAEGVENAQQLDLLRHIGCPQAQGFLLAEPLESASAIRLLSRELC